MSAREIETDFIYFTHVAQYLIPLYPHHMFNLTLSLICFPLRYRFDLNLPAKNPRLKLVSISARVCEYSSTLYRSWLIVHYFPQAMWDKDMVPLLPFSELLRHVLAHCNWRGTGWCQRQHRRMLSESGSYHEKSLHDQKSSVVA